MIYVVVYVGCTVHVVFMFIYIYIYIYTVQPSFIAFVMKLCNLVMMLRQTAHLLQPSPPEVGIASIICDSVQRDASTLDPDPRSMSNQASWPIALSTGVLRQEEQIEQ